MTDKIEPVLSAREWAGLGPNGVGHPPIPSTLDGIQYLDADDLAKAVAIATAALPDSDPRKITQQDVAFLRTVAWDGDGWGYAATVADKLAAFLPPA